MCKAPSVWGWFSFPIKLWNSAVFGFSFLLFITSVKPKHIELTLSGSCKISLKRLKKGIPKVNCMLFLNHLDYMHGFGLFWKVTLWGLFLNHQNHCKSYWYWVIELWTHWKSKKKKSVYIFLVNKSLQMTIAGSYELENTMGSQNEALPSYISNLITIP